MCILDCIEFNQKTKKRTLNISDKAQSKTPLGVSMSSIEWPPHWFQLIYLIELPTLNEFTIQLIHNFYSQNILKFNSISTHFLFTNIFKFRTD